MDIAPDNRHSLDRLTLDIITADLATAITVRERVATIAREALPTTMAAGFDQLVPANRLVRLDRLDFDLGSIALADLEGELPAGLDRAFREGLGRAIGNHAAAAEPPSAGHTEAALADFASWLLLGRPQRPGAARVDPAAVLLDFVEAAPTAVVASFDRGDRSAIVRLVRRAREAGLAALLRTLAPDQAAASLRWFAELAALVPLTPAPPLAAAVLRETLWALTLQYLLRDAGSQFNRRRWLERTLRGLAAAGGVAYRCLFHGAPGTGKTLAAALLGRRHALPVYRVDLSRVVSKWIGETEKNLARLFDAAEHRDWILFFDEAEALFGKRVESNHANDRAAKQQIACLLQRLEDFPGLVILATNQRAQMDEAFARRFQTTVLFAIPDAAGRQRLWQDMFRTGRFALADDIDFAALAGGAIVNVLRHACLLAVVRPAPIVTNADIMSGVRQELQKAGHDLSRGAGK